MEERHPDPLKDAPLEWCVSSSRGVAGGGGAGINRAEVAPPGASVADVGLRRRRPEHHSRRSGWSARASHRVDVMPQKARWAEDFGAADHVVKRRNRGSVARVQAISGNGGWIRVRDGRQQATIEQGSALHPTAAGRRSVGVCQAGTRVSLDPALVPAADACEGSSFGARAPAHDVPMLIDMFMSGKYKLKERLAQGADDRPQTTPSTRCSRARSAQSSGVLAPSVPAALSG